MSKHANPKQILIFTCLSLLTKKVQIHISWPLLQVLLSASTPFYPQMGNLFLFCPKELSHPFYPVSIILDLRPTLLSLLSVAPWHVLDS